MSLRYDADERQRVNIAENPYLEVMKIISQVRELIDIREFQMLDSEVLTWVIQGLPPKKLVPSYKDQIVTQVEQSLLDEMMCYIDDVEVEKAVKDSFRKTKSMGHLIYEYSTITDAYRQARVRILVRMIYLNNT